MIELIKPCLQYKNQYLEYLKEAEKNNEVKKLGDAGLKEDETFEDMLIRVYKITNKDNLIGMMKPTTVFWIVNNNNIVGSMNLRHELSEFTYYTIGHIGYYISSINRNKGYATNALKLAKEFYKTIGVKRLLLICEDDNVASKKVIQNNGGVLETSMQSFSGKTLERYWIDLSE